MAVTAQVHQTSGQQGIWLRGREFLANINGSPAYSKSVNVLRPTDYGVFSWLASIARKFNNYKFRDLRLIFLSLLVHPLRLVLLVFFRP